MPQKSENQKPKYFKVYEEYCAIDETGKPVGPITYSEVIHPFKYSLKSALLMKERMDHLIDECGGISFENIKR